MVREIAAIAIDDGLTFDTDHATAETIRDDDHYSGVRITLGGALSRATIARGTVNTRWRDFLDLYVVIRRHAVDAQMLRTSMQHVTEHRGAPLSPLKPALAGFPKIAQSRWFAWLRKQRLDAAAPAEFATVLDAVISFADPLISNDPMATTWNPFEGAWSSTG